MIRVAEVKVTCSGVPMQWEGRTDDDRVIFVHYRHGWLNVSVSNPGGSLDEAIDSQLGLAGADDAGQQILTAHVGGEYDGHMTAAELVGHTKDLVAWPDGFA